MSKIAKNKIIIISGPTATGKTGLSIEIAKKYGAEVINFDSLLFYKEISIGNAKPSIEEMDGVIHHLVSTHSIGSPLNAADFSRLCVPLINKILESEKIPILVGGSGFYLQTILRGMYDSPSSSIEVTKKSDELYASSGITAFLELLKHNDPKSLESIHVNDHYRIRRAVEHFWSTGLAFSKAREQMKMKEADSPPVIHNWDILHLYLDVPKEEHWEIIQKRSNLIFKSGLINEVEGILQQGFSGQEKPLKSIGYKQAISYIKGETHSQEEAIELTSIATRQLAKAQRTWFSKVKKSTYNPLEEREKIHHDVSKFIS
jgi:tRNA dimethylallyltransferase